MFGNGDLREDVRFADSLATISAEHESAGIDSLATLDAQIRRAQVTFNTLVRDKKLVGSVMAAKRAGDVAEIARLQPLIAAQNAAVQSANAELQRLLVIRDGD